MPLSSYLLTNLIMKPRLGIVVALPAEARALWGWVRVGYSNEAMGTIWAHLLRRTFKK